MLDFRFAFAVRDLINSLRRVWLFCLCLIFGVCLVMATASLYQMLNRSVLSDTRALMGGDVEIETNRGLPSDQLDWISERGKVSLTRELNTMMSTREDNFLLVELLSTDQAYPLYGELELSEGKNLQEVTAQIAGNWGAAIDPVLAEKLKVEVGDWVAIGDIELEVRALVLEQPDRRLNASWRGAPVLIADGALEQSGLLHPASRIEYEYRVKTEQDPNLWRETFFQAFPETDWEVATFLDRSERLAERLGQISSGLLIVALSTLFVGGLGVFNSISVYLQSKQETMATLKSVGLRPNHVGQIYGLQVFILASLSGLVGVLLGALLAWIGSIVLAQDLPIALHWIDLLSAAAIAWLFGLLTAFTFALPAMATALFANTANLFRGGRSSLRSITLPWKCLIVSSALMLGALILIVIPNTLFGFAFIGVVVGSVAVFEVLVRLVKTIAQKMEDQAWLLRRTALRFAIANLHRPGSSMRAILLSLGSALTLLVASTTVVMSVLKMVNETIPEESPALIFYDVFVDQKQDVETLIAAGYTSRRISLAPLVRGRVSSINGTDIRDMQFEETDWQEMARDEHKLSYLAENIDGIRVVSGAFWDESSIDGGMPSGIDFLVAMEDREANEMGLKVGDRVGFSIFGQERIGSLEAIYSQKGLQTRFWFEAIFSDGALDNYINRYVGTVYMSDDDALDIQRDLARAYPNVITVRTADLVESASVLLGKATNGLLVLASISLIVSLMVLASVMAAGKNRQIYDATILHSLGARLSYIRSAVKIEYALLASIVVLFSVLLGTLIASSILQLRLKIYAFDAYWIGAFVSAFAAALVFTIGATYLFRRLTIRPAVLLKEGG